MTLQLQRWLDWFFIGPSLTDLCSSLSLWIFSMQVYLKFSSLDSVWFVSMKQMVLDENFRVKKLGNLFQPVTPSRKNINHHISVALLNFLFNYSFIAVTMVTLQREVLLFMLCTVKSTHPPHRNRFFKLMSWWEENDSEKKRLAEVLSIILLIMSQLNINPIICILVTLYGSIPPAWFNRIYLLRSVGVTETNSHSLGGFGIVLMFCGDAWLFSHWRNAL